MLSGEWNSQQAQRALHHQQGEDQNIRAGGGGANARAQQTTLEQQQAAHQRHHAAGAARNHRHLLLHVDRQEGFVHPVRRQHTEKVAGKDPENPDMKQVRSQIHPFTVQHLAGGRAPGVLPIVVAQPAADEEHRPGDVRINVKEEHIQEVHYCCPPLEIFKYCGATAPAKRRW